MGPQERHSLTHSLSHVRVFTNYLSERARCAHNYLISCSRAAAASCVSAVRQAQIIGAREEDDFHLARWRQLAGALPVGRLVAAASVRKEKGHSLWPLGAALLESARASPPCNARAPNGSHRGRGGGRMAAAAAWVPSEPVPLRPPSGAHQCHTWISLSATVPIRQPAARPPPDTHLTPGASLRSVYHKCFSLSLLHPPAVRCVRVPLERDICDGWGAGVDASGMRRRWGWGAMFHNSDFINIQE